MTLGVSDVQSDSDLDSIRNSCDVFPMKVLINKKHICCLAAWRYLDCLEQFGDVQDLKNLI